MLISDENLKQVYEWVDQFDLSKPKRNIARDFSDGCLVAEIIHHYHSNLIERHNYYNTTNRKIKISNWEVLSKKVFPKLEMIVPVEEIQKIVDCENLVVEAFLFRLKNLLEKKHIPKPKIKTFKPQPSKLQDSKVVGQDHGLKSQESLIQDLREQVLLLENKINKLSQIIQVKDDKIKLLESRLFELGLK